MKQHIINSKKGFTIIEVVLVLAIAGLIFLMVFVALPNLQRSQHDTQRRDDYSALASSIENFRASNGGKLPQPATAGGTEPHLSSNLYINETGTDPNGEYYIIEVTAMEPNVDWNEANSPSARIGQGGIAYLQSSDGTEEGATPSGTQQVEVRIPKIKDGTYVYIIRNADCSGTSVTDASAIPAYNSANRKFVIFGDLEAGTYCEEH